MLPFQFKIEFGPRIFSPAQYTPGVAGKHGEKSRNHHSTASPQNNLQNVQLQPCFWRAPHISISLNT